MSCDGQVYDVFAADANIARMRRTYTEAFFQEFSRGLLNYEAPLLLLNVRKVA